MEYICEFENHFSASKIKRLFGDYSFHFIGMKGKNSLSDWNEDFKTDGKGKAISTVKGDIILAVVYRYTDNGEGSGDIVWVDVYSKTDTRSLRYRGISNKKEVNSGERRA